jgi:hypothetical protein
MNIAAIILIAVVIVLVYLLYTYFTSSTTTLVTSQWLKESSSPITKIPNPTYSRYAYGIWIYVNTWDPNVTKTIFNRDGNMKLYFDKSSPVLKCDFIMSDGSTQTISITNNFPIQTWAQVIISVDNQFVDCYLDGKLLTSQRLYLSNKGQVIMPATPPSKASIILGDSTLAFDANVAMFTRWTSPLGPQDAWNSYMAGNGQSMSLPYDVRMAVLKNNIPTMQVGLFPFRYASS